MSETDPPTDANPSDVSSPIPTPKLLGPTIFVYVISTLAGWIAGSMVAILSRPEPIFMFNWPMIMGYYARRSGPLGGLVAAWIWTKSMTRHVRNSKSPRRIALHGVFWGILVGWIAAVILWGFILFIFGGIEDLSPPVVPLGIECVLIFGSIGGLGAGIICGGVWAIWTRRIQQQNRI